jgi:hypothetical protein
MRMVSKKIKKSKSEQAEINKHNSGKKGRNKGRYPVINPSDSILHPAPAPAHRNLPS